MLHKLRNCIGTKHLMRFQGHRNQFLWIASVHLINLVDIHTLGSRKLELHKFWWCIYSVEIIIDVN